MTQEQHAILTFLLGHNELDIQKWDNTFSRGELCTSWCKNKTITIVGNDLPSLAVAIGFSQIGFKVSWIGNYLQLTKHQFWVECSNLTINNDFVDVALLEKLYARSAFLIYHEDEKYDYFRKIGYPRTFSYNDYSTIIGLSNQILENIPYFSDLSSRVCDKEYAVFGGSFNPFTTAHFEIIAFLTNILGKKVEVIPNGTSYKLKNLEGTFERINNLEKVLPLFENASLNLIEFKKNFNGTYQTLRELGHPYFVMGADSLKDIETWIEPLKLVEENYFIVFNRDKADCLNIIKNSTLLSPFCERFIVINHFDFVVSSSNYRDTLNQFLIPINVNNI